MKNHCHTKGLCAGLLLLRVLVSAIFLYHGISLLLAGAGAITQVGQAGAALGLTFLSATIWGYIGVISMLLIGLLLLLGTGVKIAAILIWIWAFFAMNSKGWKFPAIEYDIVLAILGFVLFATGPGCLSAYSKGVIAKDNCGCRGEDECEDTCENETGCKCGGNCQCGSKHGDNGSCGCKSHKKIEHYPNPEDL